MRNILVIIIILFAGVVGYSQQESFEKRLKLDTCSRFGSLWGNENRRWEFPGKSKSAISDNLWNHILPKSTLDQDKVIINRNELNYFLERGNVKVQSKGVALSNPEHWEERFGKQIQTLEFAKALYALIIKNNKLIKVNLNALTGIRYHTFYPHGAIDVDTKEMAPIVYSQKNQFDLHSPFLLVTAAFIEHIDLEKVKVKTEIINFGTKDFPGKVYKTGIDFNGDGQNEVLMYLEKVEDKIAEAGDESGAYQASMIAMFVKNKWYRTSYWEKGPDGLQGF